MEWCANFVGRFFVGSVDGSEIRRSPVDMINNMYISYHLFTRVLAPSQRGDRRISEPSTAGCANLSWSNFGTQEVPGWLDNFLQQEFHDLDGQVPPQADWLLCVIGENILPLIQPTQPGRLSLAGTWDRNHLVLKRKSHLFTKPIMTSGSSC